ncbi:hypothetical protein [Clostridium cibarium]|uniref:Glycosyltransferase subfamily 4-like N-terminal domain-containing protein n=1 Tax=Clostridium cibarium TaxID=2762247 RepID=A0ABR8PUC8_9CLOT|nr:hypothetical protein [Clostridium cibarium]MBD7911779.1 hypothetical protein [Clostridium cibarium]
MKILIIATYLPPYGGSGNIRLLNYINYLNELGNDIDVIGVDYPKDSIAYDKSLEDAFNSSVNIVRVNAGYLYNLFNRKKKVVKSDDDVKKETSNTKLNKIKVKVNNFIKTNLLIPDSFIFWIRPAYKEACKLINSTEYDLMLSIHETPSSHLVASKLKNKYPKIKWVGYWSDPWNGDSALRENGLWVKKKIEERLERKVVEKVDKLLFTTKSTLNFYIKKYSLNEENADVVYRGFNSELYKEYSRSEEVPEHIKEDKINIVHTGTIYSKLRDITPLCLALNKLKEENYKVYKKLNILFIGQFDSSDDEKKLREFECVKIVDFLPFKEAIKYVIKADVLLLYGNKNSSQVPGKLYEYIGSEAVVVSILGSKEDELGYIMREVDKGPIIYNEETDIFDLLNNIENSYKDYDSNWKKPCFLFTWEKVVLDLFNKLT